jgi:hypothetical protein
MSRSWEEEQALQQQYFDAIDRFDPVQHELDIEAAKLTGGQIKKENQFATPQAHRPAHNTPLSERVRAKNLAAWILRMNKK